MKNHRRGPASTMDRYVRLERPVTDTSLDGAGSGSWALVDMIWAEIQDALPSRGERLANGINAVKRPARVRIRFHAELASDMRIVDGATEVNGAVDYSRARIMQIVTLPAELGRRERQEFMVEEYRPAGNGA